MLLSTLALALPPAVCPPGLFPAEDGRCTGVEVPWRMPETAYASAFLGGDGTVILAGGATVEAEEVRPAGTVLLRPSDGAVENAPAPFGASWADQVIQLGDGRVVALRGPDPEEPGEVGVRRLEGGRWREGPRAPPQSLRGAAVLLEPDGSVVFVGGAGPGTATKKTAWRWSPATDRWTSLPAMPAGRGWPAALPGPRGPVVCGGVGTVARDAPTVPGCVALEGRVWRPVESPVTLGADTESVAIGGGVVVFDHAAVERAWWVGPDGGVRDLPTPPAARGWTAGAGPRLAALDEAGHLHWLDAATGAAESWPPVAPPGNRGGTVLPLGADTALYVGALDDDHHGAGVVGRNGGGPAGPTSDMFTVAGGLGGELARLDDGVVARWDGGRRHFSALPALPDPLSAAAVVPLGQGRVLVAGGRTGDTPSARAWTGDAAGWVPLPPLPVPLVDATGVLLGDGGVVVAGAVARGQGASFRLDPAHTAWVVLSLPDPAPGRVLPLGTAAAWVRDELWDQPEVSVAVLGPSGWRAVDPVPGVDTEVALTGTSDGALIAAGGRTGSDYGGVAAAWRLAPGASTWSALPALSRERWGGSLVELSPGVFLLVGGEAPAERFDGTRWVPGAPLAIERRSPHAFALDPTTALVFGGFTEEDGPDWELYRVLGAPTAFPAPPAPDPRLDAHPALGRRLVAAEVACSAGDRAACVAAAAIWAEPPLSDAARAAERRARACTLGHTEACP